MNPEERLQQDILEYTLPTPSPKKQISPPDINITKEKIKARTQIIDTESNKHATNQKGTYVPISPFPIHENNLNTTEHIIDTTIDPNLRSMNFTLPIPPPRHNIKTDNTMEAETE